MDLRHGTGGEWRGIDLLEEGVVEVVGELVLEAGADLFEGDARNIVLELAKLLGPFGWDEVGAGGEDLAHLDEGGAELFEGAADALFPLEVFEVRGTGGLTDAVQASLDEAVEADLLHDVAEAVLGENGGDLAVAADVADLLGDVEDGGQCGLRGAGTRGVSLERSLDVGCAVRGGSWGLAAWCASGTYRAGGSCDVQSEPE